MVLSDIELSSCVDPDGPAGPAAGDSRVFRGGSWNLSAEDARAANRRRFSPDYRFNFVGFRLARTIT